MPKLPVLHLKRKRREAATATESLDAATHVDTPAIQRARRHIERLERQKAQLLEQVAQRERAIQDQRWMTVIRRVAPGWSLETVAGGLAAAFEECREDPTYFEEITTFGKTLVFDAPEQNP
ncbi:hypothetical protein [Acidithiobacillus ferrooxidans]|uniref:hypothetical protein n=1 Tax=Acidithiobacillus ferrooxidans TaxID=920 RepID=UPI0013D337D7|nr:hypothetical protein [Acidithiobacillus ferrooxidans]